MISLIVTVFNEGDSIRRLMESLLVQSRQPDEIVIVDAGSTDKTVAIIESYADRLPLCVLIEPGCNISAGRNRAIEAAQGDIIAVTDAGVQLTQTWLEYITRPLLDDESAQVVSGFFRADPHTPFEIAMGATVLPLEDEINPDTFLPSSRSVAFRKSVWEAVGGYPEWLDFSEDLIFDLRLKQVTTPFIFQPDALVYFRPRSSLREFYKQYYLYARGDGKADLWRKRHAIRYATYLLATPFVFLLGLLIHPAMWLLYLVGISYYLYRPYRRLSTVRSYGPHTSRTEVLYIIALIPIIRAVG
ncbi:MAG: glycosyltransferase, partial [Chloroflexi bacterium]